MDSHFKRFKRASKARQALRLTLAELGAVEMRLLLQVAAAVGIPSQDRRGGHAPSSLGPPLQCFVRAAVGGQHFSARKRN